MSTRPVDTRCFTYARRMTRPLLLLIVGLFFAYRAWNLNENFHLVVAFIFMLLSGVAFVDHVRRVGEERARNRLGTRWPGIALNLGVIFAFLDLVFAQLEWDRMGQILTQVQYWVLLPAFVVVVFSLFLRAWRWQWLLRVVGEIPFAPVFRASCIGIGANMVLPARAGEFLRAYVLGRRTGHSKTAIFATLVMERILDGLSILFILVVVMLFGVSSEEIHVLGAVGSAFYLIALGALLLFYYRQAWVIQQAQRLLPDPWSARIVPLLSAFGDGLHTLRNARQLLIVSAQSLLIWLVISGSFYPVMLAFDFGAPVPLFTPFLLTALVALGLTVPSTPGGLGIIQYMAVLSLQLSFAAAAITPTHGFAEQAAAFSVLMHISQALPEVGFGAWAFITEGMHWHEVGQRETEVVT
ncbi:MAG: flippase-like domain-containing protein [Anaerolineae bacterium]|nr:flippase-like domain-containing protein [Anaerolineae bacterium]MDW8070193.1 lysylphosphatidylglycerol synthase transmembrane domain-containing protein [Anaerolineae bacterium]